MKVRKSLRVLAMLMVVATGNEAMAQNVKVTANGCRIEITYFDDATVRVLKVPQSVTNPYVDPYVVTAKPQNVQVKVTDEGGRVSATGKQLVTSVDKTSGCITVTRTDGTALVREVGSTSFTPFDDNGTSTLSWRQDFGLTADEQVYGLGIQQNGRLSQRGAEHRLVQGNQNDVIPVVTSSRGYSVFWDNLSPMNYKEQGGTMSLSAEVGDCLDYYVMDGGSADGCVREMRALTGRAPMQALWSYGFWQSKERYKSFNELKGVVANYRKLGVPIDGIIQDWQYWGNNYLWNAMECLDDGYINNPKGNIDDIHKMNAHTIFSIWSSFGPHTKVYAALDSIGALLKGFYTWPESGLTAWPPRHDYRSGVVCYDPYNEKARDIYWNYVSNGLFSLGLDGFWMDSTEPDVNDSRPEADMKQMTSVGSLRKVRNAYPLMTVENMAKHMRESRPEQRNFILTRSVFAGQQRTGANTWTGDTQASWETLLQQIAAGQNYTLCANPQFNSDIGGFFRGRYHGVDDRNFRELYVRWMQYGAFTPMMRSHGTDFARELYQYGHAGQPTYDALVTAVKWRYRLLPYIYSTSYDVSQNDGSFLRAFVFDFADDAQALDVNDEYMFGHSFLVAPIVKPANEAKDWRVGKDEAPYQPATRSIYLPKGAKWYDYWTNEKFEGGSNVKKTVAIDRMPLYVRAGSIIPVGPDVQWAQEKSWDNLTIKVYPGANGTFNLYEDSGDGYGYEQGECAVITFKYDDRSRRLTIDKVKGSFPGMLKSRTFNVVTPTGYKAVRYNGKKVSVKL